MSLDWDVLRFGIGRWRALGGVRGGPGDWPHRGDDFKPQEEEKKEDQEVDGVVEVEGEKEREPRANSGGTSLRGGEKLRDKLGRERTIRKVKCPRNQRACQERSKGCSTEPLTMRGG